MRRRPTREGADSHGRAGKAWRPPVSDYACLFPIVRPRGAWGAVNSQGLSVGDRSLSRHTDYYRCATVPEFHRASPETPDTKAASFAALAAMPRQHSLSKCTLWGFIILHLRSGVNCTKRHRPVVTRSLHSVPAAGPVPPIRTATVRIKAHSPRDLKQRRDFQIEALHLR